MVKMVQLFKNPFNRSKSPAALGAENVRIVQSALAAWGTNFDEIYIENTFKFQISLILLSKL